ncbi:MAG TPA: FABP family protein [Pseudonocardia sp.]|jgi:hypothetical protein|nr:FABP family protein [Pseudonocardia sp.]
MTSSPQLNLPSPAPELALPIPSDTANLREGPDLHPQCLSLLPLVGVWRGVGQVVYPTIEGPQHFGQQITFAHDGRPFLVYTAQSWLLDGENGNVVRPAARETGFWRPKGDDTIEVMLAHATGIMEIFYGTARTTTSWELVTDAVVRTESAKEVNNSQRLYGLIDSEDPESNGKDLAYVDERAMVGEDLQPHLSARLRRIAG